MRKLFAVVNGQILESLGDNITPTYTRIHYLLNGLKKFDGVEVMSISFNQVPKKGWGSIFYNNIIKIAVAIRSASVLIRYRPMVYFAYPHSLTTVQNRAIFRLCELLNLKIILDVHDTIEQAGAVGFGKSLLDRNLERHCFEKANLILALNQPMWERLKQIYHLTNKNVIFVPNAFEDELIKLYPDAYKSIDKRFNICYLGALTRNRGIDLLVQTCKRLHDKYPYLRLYLLGFYGESISSELKKTIEESDFIIRKEVPRKELPQSIKDMDLFVMPYDPNVEYMNFSSPTKLFEYIGTGKPILCTICESLLDLNEGSGIIYFKYDHVDLESKIEQMINNPQRREKLSEKIMAMRPMHTWNKRSEEIYRAIESL